jgi:hypothetical protein
MPNKNHKITGRARKELTKQLKHLNWLRHLYYYENYIKEFYTGIPNNAESSLIMADYQRKIDAINYQLNETLYNVENC